MGKKELQTRLVTELTNIGLPTEISTSSDIVINQRFTEEYNHGAILYHSKILLDSSTETIYFWETIQAERTETSMPTTDEEKHESTKHYKVKSIGLDRTGQQHEITLDLATIPVFIKSFAKSQHWSFKLVTSEDKASYTNALDTSISTNNASNSTGCFTMLLIGLLAIIATIALLF